MTSELKNMREPPQTRGRFLSLTTPAIILCVAADGWHCHRGKTAAQVQKVKAVVKDIDTGKERAYEALNEESSSHDDIGDRLTRCMAPLGESSFGDTRPSEIRQVRGEPNPLGEQ